MLYVPKISRLQCTIFVCTVQVQLQQALSLLCVMFSCSVVISWREGRITIKLYIARLDATGVHSDS